MIDCLDGCAFDPLKLDPGICGCAIPDTDTDADGTADCLDFCDNDPDKTRARFVRLRAAGLGRGQRRLTA